MVHGIHDLCHFVQYIPPIPQADQIPLVTHRGLAPNQVGLAGAAPDIWDQMVP